MSLSRNRCGFFFLLQKVESFLHKDVTFVVTGNQDSLKEEKSVASKGEERGADEGDQDLMKKLDGGLSKDKQRPGTPRLVRRSFSNRQTLEKISNCIKCTFQMDSQPWIFLYMMHR